MEYVMLVCRGTALERQAESVAHVVRRYEASARIGGLTSARSFTQEPTDHFYGTDMRIRDPFGNPIRILQHGRAFQEATA